MSEKEKNRPAPMRPHGPHGPEPMGAGEKAENFKRSGRELLRYLKPFRGLLVLVMLFAAVSTVFAILGPKVLALATDELAAGLMRTITGLGKGSTLAILGRCCWLWAGCTW